MKFLTTRFSIAVVILTTVMSILSSCNTQEKIMPAQIAKEISQAKEYTGVDKARFSLEHEAFQVYQAIEQGRYFINFPHIRAGHAPGVGLPRGKGEFFKHIGSVFWEDFVEEGSFQVIEHLARVKRSTSFTGIRGTVQGNGRLKVDATYRNRHHVGRDGRSQEPTKNIRFVFNRLSNEGHYELLTSFPFE